MAITGCSFGPKADRQLYGRYGRQLSYRLRPFAVVQVCLDACWRQMLLPVPVRVHQTYELRQLAVAQRIHHWRRDVGERLVCPERSGGRVEVFGLIVAK